MKRAYQQLIEQHLSSYRQMVFITGPRQVGKTRLSKELGVNFSYRYLNWDSVEDRATILAGAKELTASFNDWPPQQKLFIFDEIHKYPDWKSLIKGYFDHLESDYHFIITGSAKLDVYRKGGDSMMGRYFLYRIHPFSVAECLHSEPPKAEIRAPRCIEQDDWEALLNYGGFPEPFLKRERSFYMRWQRLKNQQLFREDVRDVTKVQETAQLQLLAELLKHHVGANTSYATLAKKIRVSEPTIRRWMELLNAIYYSFTIRPWSENISRSLLKEPKFYLWDWSLLRDDGAKHENLVASHLLKAVHFWTDSGLGDYELFYIRDKDKREVDFLVVKNKQPKMLVEVKSSGKAKLSSSLVHYAKQLDVLYAFQVAFDLDYVNQSCFEAKGPVIVPAKTFLSQFI
jgi:predicted AAA+ superfamily ATPase